MEYRNTGDGFVYHAFNCLRVFINVLIIAALDICDAWIVYQS